MNASDLLLNPHKNCGASEQACPLMRMCPCCGRTFDTSRGRRQHQNRCPQALAVPTVEAQHEHVVEVHRIRNRRSGKG